MNPGALAKLGKERETLIKYLRGTTVPKAQQQLTALTMGAMRKIARENFHPAVRYNASLVLGMLDEKYPQGGGNAAPPVVLSTATNELLELLESNEFNDVKVHPSVKVGALQGLERHVQFGWTRNLPTASPRRHWPLSRKTPRRWKWMRTSTIG